MPIHVQIKELLKKVLPKSLFKLIVKIWRKTLAPFFTKEEVSQKYYDLYISQHEPVVSTGPFTGLKYIPESAGSVLFHKLVGYYEEVLHPTIETLKQDNFDTIIDIGCAEGYYLIGLGRHFSSAHLIGYDIDERALALSRNLFDINHLNNKITLDANCTFAKLESNITNNTLLICDAEGFEDYILDPSLAPTLLNVKQLIVETHEFAAPKVIENLTKRFSKTHTLETITFKQADYQKYPFLNTITNKSDLYTLLRERGEQEQVWLNMRRII